MRKKRLSGLLFLFLFPLFLLAQENTAVACGDGIDNDGDGLIDCMDDECATLPNNGCATCFDDGLSFADTVLAYAPECAGNQNEFPLEALGVADVFTTGADVSLGEGGSITLGFTNNIIVNSSDNRPDIWVFEVGFRVESSSIELRPFDQATTDILVSEGTPDADGNGYFDFGNIAGATSSLDIDAIVSGYNYADLKFDAIKITDVPDDCRGDTPGADIDAVCALSSLELDCAGVINGTAVLDNCDQCLQPDDPLFNMCPDCDGVINGPAEIDGCGQCLDPADPLFNDCLDCAGTPNGTAITDDCGQCLQPDNPNYNNCLDCADVPFGTAVIDSCGNCLTPSDPSYNSCLDCANVPFGSSAIDSCGLCLELRDPFFNRLCEEEKLIFIPNIFTPNADGFNDKFQVFAFPGFVQQVKKYIIYDRWGGVMHQAFNFDIVSSDLWWNALPNDGDFPSGVYVYFIELELYNGEIRTFSGDITLVR